MREITDVSRATAYRLEMKGEFPRRVSLPGGRIGWFQDELMEWAGQRECHIEGD